MKSLLFSRFLPSIGGILVLAMSCANSLHAQLPTAQGDIVPYSTKDIITAQGTLRYAAPSAQQQALWTDVMTEMLRFNFVAAHQKALALGYQVTEFTDMTTTPQKKLYVLEKSTPGQGINFWGKYMVNPSPARPALVIQSPHPVFDFNTGLQGAQIFRETGAVLFCVAGTHRCNDTAASQCAGTTTVCFTDGNLHPFRRSDQAHNIDGMFQITTKVAIASLINPIIISVHGFDKGAGEPDVIIGNGTQQAPVPPLVDYALLVKQQLQAFDASLTFKVAHIDLTWTQLTGTTNMQGRLLNNSTDPCTRSATAPTGRFVHIEQAKIGLRDTPTNWSKLARALTNSIPATVVAPQLSVTPSSLSIGAAGGALTGISVSANGTWTASSNQSWLQVTTSAGTGNAPISATAQANTSTSSRQAVITITSAGLQQTVTITQQGAEPQLSVSPTALSIAAAGGALTGISVSANGTWTASSNQSWLQVTTSAGTGNGQLSGTVQANTSTNSRLATISVSGCGLLRTVSVTQQGQAVMLSVSPASIAVPKAGRNGVTVAVKANVAWSATANQSWMTLNTITGSINDSLRFDVAANSSGAARAGIITLSASGQTASLGVQQEANVGMTVVSGTAAPHTTMIIPNPVNETVTVRMNVEQAGSVLLRIVNAMGDVVLQQSLHYQKPGYYDETLPVSHLPSGAYTLVVSNPAGKGNAVLLIAR